MFWWLNKVENWLNESLTHNSYQITIVSKYFKTLITFVTKKYYLQILNGHTQGS